MVVESLGKGGIVNSARMQALADGQTGIAKKVYSCVPIAEVWPVAHILAELSRTGSRPDTRIVSGCLSALVHGGLIRERPRGHFQRIVIRAPAPARPTLVITKTEDTPVAPTPSLVSNSTTTVPLAVDPLTRLVDIGVKLRAVADEIDEIALAIEERTNLAGAELATLRQLKALLRNLG